VIWSYGNKNINFVNFRFRLRSLPDADLTAMSKTAAGIWKRCSLDVRKELV
jgi:hypothetical protein